MLAEEDTPIEEVKGEAGADKGVHKDKVEEKEKEDAKEDDKTVSSGKGESEEVKAKTTTQIAATTANQSNEGKQGDALLLKQTEKPKQPEKYYFKMITFPAVHLAGDARPASLAYGLEHLGLSTDLSLRSHLHDINEDELERAAEFQQIPAPTELELRVSNMYSQGRFGPTEERTRLLQASVNRAVQAYYNIVKGEPKFMRDLQQWDPTILDVHTYFHRLSAAMEWWAIVEIPRRRANFSQAVRAASTNTQYMVRFNQLQDSGAVHTARATVAVARMHPIKTAACCLCTAGVVPAAFGTTLLAAVGGCASATWPLLKAAVVNPYTLGAAALCACSAVPEDVKSEVVVQVMRGTKRLRDHIYPPSDEDPPNEVRNSRQGSGRDSQFLEGKGAPEIMTMVEDAKSRTLVEDRAAPDPNSRPHKMPCMQLVGEDLATGATSTSTGSVFATDDVKLATRATSTSIGSTVEQAPRPYTGVASRPDQGFESMMTTAQDRTANPSVEGGGWWTVVQGFGNSIVGHNSTRLFGSIGLTPTGYTTVPTVNFEELEEGTGVQRVNTPMVHKEKEEENQDFRKPTHASSEWSRLNRNAGPASVHHLDDRRWSLFATYGGHFDHDPGYEPVALVPRKYDTSVLLDYKNRAGTYQASQGFAVYTEPEPYRNPDNCPFFFGTTCLLPAPDGQDPGLPLDPKLQLDKAFQGSWEPKEHPKALNRHEREDAVLRRATDLFPEVDAKIQSKRWWHTGLLWFDAPCFGYAATAKNFMDGMGRHYGTACTGCECDDSPRGPILDYHTQGTCARCQLWNEADLLTRFWSDLLPALGQEYLESTPRSTPPPSITTLVDKIRAGETIGTYSAADDSFGLASWWCRLDANKRRIYGRGIDAYISGNVNTVARFAMSSAIKWEKGSQVDPFGKSKRLKEPRLICPSKDPTANLVSGPLFWAISEALKRQTQCWLKTSIDTCAPPVTVTSGCNPLEAGEILRSWYDEGFSIVVELDFSRLDSTENKNFAQVADRIMGTIITQNCLIHDESALDALFRSMTHRKVYTTFGKFQYIYGLCSGFGGTFHRNTIGVTVAVLGRVMANLSRLWPEGTDGVDLTTLLRFMGLGDDCLLVFRDVPPTIAKEVLNATVTDLTTMGLRPSPVASQVPSFCSALFWPIVVDDKETFVLAPELLRQLSRFGATFNHKFPQCTNAQARALCAGTVKSNPFWQALPVLRVIYFYYINMEVKADYSQQEWHKTFVKEPHTYGRSPRVLQFVEIAYGLNAIDIKQLEDELHTALLASDARPCLFSSPLLHTAALHFHRMRGTSVFEAL